MAIPYSRTIFGNISWYSLLIVIGILLAIWISGREEKRLLLPKDTVIDLSLIIVPCGIIGARLYYVAMTWNVFAQNPISILYIWEGGVAIYGAVIGGAIGAFFYAKRKKLSFLQLADVLAPGLLLAQAIGRWGNYFNMEAHGTEILNQQFWFFPAGVLIPSDTGYTWYIATFFYESLWNFGGVAALWLLRKRQHKHGDLFCWYLLIYGSGRFIIEQLRTDSLYLGSFRVSQYLSLLVCAGGIAVLLWHMARGHKKLLALAMLTAILLLARWAFLKNAWVYGGLMVLSIAGIVFCSLQKGSRLYWLLIPALLDILGLIAFCVGQPFSASFALRLHTLICSLTLPIYVSILCCPANEQSRPPMHKGGSPCRSES